MNGDDPKEFVAREAAGCIRVIFWLLAIPLSLFILFMVYMLLAS